MNVRGELNQAIQEIYKDEEKERWGTLELLKKDHLLKRDLIWWKWSSKVLWNVYRRRRIREEK